MRGLDRRSIRIPAVTINASQLHRCVLVHRLDAAVTRQAALTLPVGIGLRLTEEVGLLSMHR
jgi:hypothetical protein